MSAVCLLLPFKSSLTLGQKCSIKYKSLRVSHDYIHHTATVKNFHGLIIDLIADTKKPTQRSVSVSTSTRRDGTSGRT